MVESHMITQIPYGGHDAVVRVLGYITDDNIYTYRVSPIRGPFNGMEYARENCDLCPIRSDRLRRELGLLPYAEAYSNWVGGPGSSVARVSKPPSKPIPPSTRTIIDGSDKPIMEES